MTLTERDKKLLAMLAILGALAGYWFLALKPKRSEVTKLDSRIAAKEKQLDGVKQRIAADLAAQVTYASDYTTVVRLGKAVTEDYDGSLSSLLVQLDVLAGKKIAFTEVGVEKYPTSLLAPSLSGTPASTLGSQPAAEGSKAPDNSATATQGASGNSSAGSSTGEPGTQPAGLPFRPLEVRLKFEGNFFKLHKLLANIDRLVRLSQGRITVRGRLVFVEGLKVKQGRAGFPQVSVSVGAIVFSLPKDESLAGGATREAPPQDGPQPVSGNSSSPSDESTPTAVSTPSAP